MSKKIWISISLVVVFAMVLAACQPAATPTEAPPVEAATEVPTEPPPPEPTEPPAAVPTEEPEEPPEEPMVELLIWADEIRSPIINDIGSKFAGEYGVQLTVQEMGFGDIRDQLAIAGPAGEGPDIIIGAHDWLGQLTANGLVAPLDLGDQANQFLPAALTAFTYDGELYGMPYATENIAFFCNPDIVETPPATWDEVSALAEQLESDSGGEVTAWSIQTADAYHFFPLMSSFDGYIFGLTEEGYDASDVGLDSEGSIAAGNWIEEMAIAGHVEPDVDYDVLHALFTGGQVACIGTGPWALSMIRDSGVNYTINPFPVGATEAGRPFLGVQGFMVSAFSEDSLLAQTVLTEIFGTEEFMQAMYEADPRPAAFLPVREGIDDPDLAAFAVAGAKGMPMPAIPEMASVWEALQNAVVLVISQQQDAETAFANAAEQVRTAIAE